MPSAEKKTCLTLLFVLLLGLAAPASAAEITLPDSDVWLNPEQDVVELEYECSTVENITFSTPAEQIEFNPDTDSGALKTSDLRKEDLDTGKYEVKLNCMNESSPDETSIELKKLNVESKSGGKSFFAARTGQGEFASSPEIDFEIAGNEDINLRDLEFTSLDPDVSNPDWDFDLETLDMTIEDDFRPTSSGQEDEIEFNVTYDSRISTDVEVPVEVYPWKPVFIGNDNPGRTVNYDDLGDLNYHLDIRSAEGFPSELHDENFEVKIEDLGTGEERVYEDVIEEEPDGEADYRLSLGSMPELDTGEYRFTFRVTNNGREAPIDSVRVVNSMKFEGQVRDSTGRGVKTDIVMINDDRTVPLSTGSDGRYSAEIGDNMFQTVNLDFFDREKSGSDTSFVLDQVDLGLQAAKGGSEAIKYQYWENSPVSVSGLDPVNMMAVKFGHHIGEGAQASMAFNPSNVNPEQLKVFECTSWNFLGRSCMSSWEKVSSEDVSVNYKNWRVKINNLKLHHISEETGGEEQDILMNAYLVGTNSQLGLRGEETPLNVNSARIAAGGDLEVSGTVMSSQGSRVENVNVTVELLNGSKVVRDYTTLSDPDGSFTVNGGAPSTAGEYRMRVHLEKNPYQSFTKLSDSSLEVFYEKGVEISNPDDLHIQLGREEDLAFELENVGQVPVRNMEVSLEGLESDLYKQVSAPETVGVGETSRVVYRLDIPESYCPYPCGQPPRFNVQLEGDALDERVTAMTTVFTQVNRPNPEENTTASETSSQDTENRSDQDSSKSFLSSATETVVGPTGAFLERQSSLNIALGLIMIFTMILAAAVKKKKTSDSGRGRFGGRNSGFQSYSGNSGNSNFGSREPDTGDFGEDITNRESSGFKSSTPELVDAKEANRKDQDNSEKSVDSSTDELETAEQAENSEDLEEAKNDPGKYVCEETGEVFDTKTALKMHKQINGIE